VNKSDAFPLIDDDLVDKYDYDRFGVRAKRVGQAACDILSKEQPFQTVGDILDAYGPQYAAEIEKCIEDNKHKYNNPFYVFVITKKEAWVNNVVRNWFIARQTPPHAFRVMEEYSNYVKTLYVVDGLKGKIKICWSLPSFHDCVRVAKNPSYYSQELVGWIEECFSRKLDKDEYSFDE
jgi:hypothetical protein